MYKISSVHLYVHIRVFTGIVKQESLANAKVSTRQECMYEGP